MDKLSSGAYKLLKQVNRRGADNVDTFYSIWFPTLYKLGYVDLVLTDGSQSERVNAYVINEKGKAAIRSHQRKTFKKWFIIVMLLLAAFLAFILQSVIDLL